MKSGLPEAPEEYSIVEVGELKVRVSGEMLFSGDIPKISVFPRKNGRRDVGVSNVLN